LKQGRKIYPTEVYLPQKATGLDKESIAMTHQIRSISKERLGSGCGKINDPKLMEQIQETIKLYLGIS
jgi:mRNA interferase MazF